MKLNRLIGLMLAFVACSIGHAVETLPLILISLDAFRWDYCTLHPAETPNLRRLIREGTSARALIPVFPSNTFSNHYSIATGLYPSHHGIINNVFFDPDLGEIFRYTSSTSARDTRWWLGEPIWITAVKQGRHSACSFWPGSEAVIRGSRPTYWKPYDYNGTSFEKRLDELAGWLARPASERPTIITFYLEETNTAGHNRGPDSPELASAVKLLDARVGAMVARLQADGTRANLVIVSDHGMTSCGNDRVLLLDDYLDIASVQIDFEESCVGLRPRPGTEVASLLKALANIPALQAVAYRAEDLPTRFHIDASNPRVPPIWIVPAEGWHVVRRSLYQTMKTKFIKGQHGYDNALPSMHGIFIAHGPSFKSDVVIDPVENIHIYNLLCAALALAPAPNDGDDRLVRATLR